MNLKSTSPVVLLFLLPLFSGCWYAAAAGAGAYGGYKAKEEGYTVQSPVKKVDKTSQKKEEPAKKESR